MNLINSLLPLFLRSNRHREKAVPNAQKSAHDSGGKFQDIWRGELRIKLFLVIVYIDFQNIFCRQSLD